jgi:5-methylcytosine-specific restriction endonuclease McrBC regulatory subunit McrC
MIDFGARLGRLHLTSEAVHGNAASAALLRPLLYLTFIGEVEQQLKHIRRDYEPVTETLGVIRGRIDSRSLAVAIASQVPRVRCNYEDFTHRTPLMRVLASATEVIVWDRFVPARAYSDSGEIARIGDRAIRIRRELEDVDVLERRMALDVGRRLRLNRASARWQTALDLALAILAATEFLPPGAAGRQRTIEIRLNTNDMWESVLRQALQSAAKTGPIVLHTRVDQHVPAAWIPVGGAPGARAANPDYLVTTKTPERLWCLDAKYKILDHRSPPSDDDRYQMYAYTHLSTAPGSPVPFVTHSGLLYPSPADITPPVAKVRYDRGGDRVPTIPLYVKRLSFPKPSDVRSDTNWRVYLAETSGQLVAFLTG